MNIVGINLYCEKKDGVGKKRNSHEALFSFFFSFLFFSFLSFFFFFRWLQSPSLPFSQSNQISPDIFSILGFPFFSSYPTVTRAARFGVVGLKTTFPGDGEVNAATVPTPTWPFVWSLGKANKNGGKKTGTKF
jgi:hypothetical protein